MVDTLSFAARYERIAQVTSATEAHRSIISTTVRAWFAISVNSARIRVTQITFVEWAAAIERMTGIAFRARADCFVVLYATFGSDTASVGTRINALKVETSLRIGTLFVLCTLGVTASERIAKEVGRTRADGTVIANVAIGIGSARAAGILTAEVHTGAIGIAFEIRFAFTPATLDRITHPSIKTRANSAVVLYSAFGIGSARSRVTIIATLTADDVVG